MAEHTRLAVERIDPQRGVMLDAVWLRDAGVLLLTAHVLALDPASWRIVLGELEAGWHALMRQEAVRAGASTPRFDSGRGSSPSAPNASTPATSGSGNSTVTIPTSVRGGSVRPPIG